MEEKFFRSTFSDFESNYVLDTHNVENYNPAEIIQEILYKIHLKKYIKKSEDLVAISKVTNESISSDESKADVQEDLSVFEQQKIYLNYILLLDPNEVMVKRYHKDFSIPQSLARLQPISQARYRSIMERIIQINHLA